MKNLIYFLKISILVSLVLNSCSKPDSYYFITPYTPIIADDETIEENTGFFAAESFFKETPSLDNLGKIILLPGEDKMYLLDYYKGIYVSSISHPALDTILAAPGIVSFAIYDDYIYFNVANKFMIYNRKTKEKISENKDFFPELAPPDGSPIPLRIRQENREANTCIIGWTLEDLSNSNEMYHYQLDEPFFVTDYFNVVDQLLYIAQPDFLVSMNLYNPTKPQYYSGRSFYGSLQSVKPFNNYVAVVTATGVSIVNPELDEIYFYLALQCSKFQYLEEQNFVVFLTPRTDCIIDNNKLYVRPVIFDFDTDTLTYYTYLENPTDIAKTDSTILVCDNDVRFFLNDSLPVQYQVDSLGLENARKITVKDSVLAVSTDNELLIYYYHYDKTKELLGAIPLKKIFINSIKKQQ